MLPKLEFSNKKIFKKNLCEPLVDLGSVGIHYVSEGLYMYDKLHAVK